MATNESLPFLKSKGALEDVSRNTQFITNLIKQVTWPLSQLLISKAGYTAKPNQSQKTREGFKELLWMLS